MNEYQKMIAFLKIQIQNFGTLHRHLSGDNAGIYTIYWKDAAL